VTSLARPGGNITGSTRMSPDLSRKRIELLKEAAPKTSRVAVILSTTTLLDKDELREMESEARQSSRLFFLLLILCVKLHGHFSIAILGKYLKTSDTDVLMEVYKDIGLSSLARSRILPCAASK
jgi:hypothetical protein